MKLLRGLILAGLLSLADVAHADITHTVQPGQTLTAIARSYGVSVAAIAEANKISDPSQINAGRRLVIPGARRADKPARARPASPPRPPGPLASVAAGATWPVEGTILSGFAAPRFGSRTHKGLDIKSPRGSPVRAMADGVVSEVKERFGEYGRFIAVDHGRGVVTCYAHNSENLVEEGQRVAAGDVIASVGKSGNASVEHLHFEVRLNGETIDPRRVLPSSAKPVVTASRRTDPSSEPAAQAEPAGARRIEPLPARKRAEAARQEAAAGKGPPPE